MRDPWRTVAFALAFVLLIGVGIGAAMIIGRPEPSPSIGPSPTIPASATAPTSSEAASPAASSASASPSSEPSASLPVASPSASPTASGEAPATATVRGLKVDAQDDPLGRHRRLTFSTDDPTTIAIRIARVSAGGTVDACLALNGRELYCTSGSTFTMSGQTSRSNASWELSLRGVGADAPVLDVAIEFAAAAPAITIHDAWFDGAARPGNNGVFIELSPLLGPEASIEAAWEGSHTWRLTVRPPSGSALVVDGSGNAMTQDLLLGGGLNRIELVNTGGGAEHVPLTVTIAWH